MARRIRSRMGLEHFEQRSNVLWNVGTSVWIRVGMTEEDEERDAFSVSCSFTYNVTALTVTLLVQGVEGLPSETGVAGDASETLHMEHLLHGDTTAAITDHVVATPGTAT